MPTFTGKGREPRELFAGDRIAMSCDEIEELSETRLEQKREREHLNGDASQVSRCLGDDRPLQRRDRALRLLLLERSVRALDGNNERVVDLDLIRLPQRLN